MTQNLRDEDIKNNWFEELLQKFSPSESYISGKSIQQMIDNASKKAFAISAAAAIPPGFLGMATVLPEVAAVTKIQLNLIYSIAKHHKQADKVNALTIALIFANAFGLSFFRGAIKKEGRKLIIGKIARKLVKPVLKRISAKIIARLFTRLPARWIPLILSPIFGLWSSSNTRAIGKAADELFIQKVIFEEGAEEEPRGKDIEIE